MKDFSTIYILDSNEISREIFKSYIEDFDLNCEVKSYSNYNEGLDSIKTTQGDITVCVDISEISNAQIDIIEQIKSYTSKIIITSTNYSTDTIVKAMRLGAQEFLPKPVLKSDLERAIKTIITQELNPKEDFSKIITVYSNKGGIGKTTIATNLAVEIAKTTTDKVALIDLNLQLGDISTFLNLKPSFDVAYFIRNLTNKKEENFINAFEKYENSNLYILSDPNYIEQSEGITPFQIENLFKTLRKVFSYIILDISANIDPNSLKILDKSDMILFTTIVNIPAIRNAQRCLTLFDSRKYNKNKVKIIINRYMENDEIKIEDIETVLDRKIYWKIPNNYFSIMEAINKGVPVNKVNSSSNITENFRELAEKISNEFVEDTILKNRGK